MKIDTAEALAKLYDFTVINETVISEELIRGNLVIMSLLRALIYN